MFHVKHRDVAILDELEPYYRAAVERGFLGPREGERLRERHLNDALGLATIRAPKPGEQWADLGSGVGLPGLPLAAAFPSTSFTLVDAQRRRLDWAADTAQALGLGNVSFVHARLEDYGRGPARGRFDVATARALGPLPVVAELGLPLLRIGGLLIVPRGQPTAEELQRAGRACALLGGRLEPGVHNPSSPIDRVSFVVIMTKIAATSPRFPRRSGVPARTPLGQGR
ncbi:MAG TPA: 16S rRNA (guanine(527)-N(7))-methyltransferase RsmG [Actinomycetes bacterium]|jgi:16S rRNA (guanine527-N7)-methyltransferase|nr:16S rRNA (guanine(527)-N(7))-methyltransferase RsmG [Actinomycetes bacterium]